jgi:AraC-like DNA-binding protein
MKSDGVLISPLLFARLDSLGIDAAHTLRLAGLSGTLPSHGKITLTTREHFALWEAIGTVSHDLSIGLRIGAESATGELDIASAAALHCATFGGALRTVARYKHLTCPEEVRIELQGDEVRIHYRWLLADSATPELLTDAMFASAVALGSRGAGKAIKPKRIELTRPVRRTRNRQMFANHFGCEIRFDSASDVMVFARATLETPFVTHDEDFLAMVSPGLNAALKAQASTQSLLDRVEAILVRCIQGQRPSVEALARALGMSSRTLQRRLTEHDTNYQQQLDRVRQRTARRLLSQTTLEPGEIAFFLGFEEVNSFSRAFHQWEGVTPHRWRGIEQTQEHEQTY